MLKIVHDNITQMFLYLIIYSEIKEYLQLKTNHSTCIFKVTAIWCALVWVGSLIFIKLIGLFLCMERGRRVLALEFAMHVFRISKINACAPSPTARI